MRAKPVFKTEYQALQEEINKKVDDFRGGIKEIIKEVVQDKDSGISKNIDDIIDRKIREAESGVVSVEGSDISSSSKLGKMINIIKEKRSVSHDDKDDIINCPTCHSGHMHALTKDMGNMGKDGKKSHDGVSFRCTGPECGTEYVMVDKKADYKCSNCNAPIMKPKDEKTSEAYDGCPFCHGAKAIKHDWSKTWKVTRK